MNALFHWSGRLAHALSRLSMLLLGLLVVVICADVAMRSAGLKPLAWVTDLAEYILLYVTFLPAAALVRGKGHVFVEFLRAPLPSAWQRALEKLIYALCVLLSAYLAWVASALLGSAIATHAYDARAFDMPRWLVYLPMSLGLWLAALEWLRFLLGRDSMYALDALARDGY